MGIVTNSYRNEQTARTTMYGGIPTCGMLGGQRREVRMGWRLPCAAARQLSLLLLHPSLGGLLEAFLAASGC